MSPIPSHSIKRLFKSLALSMCLLPAVVFASQRADVAWQWIENGAVVIDVRTPSEFESGHLENALNIPVSELAQADLSFLSHSDDVVVYCRSGNRSGAAHKILVDMGYRNIHNGGGLQEMQAERNK